MKRTTIQCDKCGKQISKSNYDKHINGNNCKLKLHDEIIIDPNSLQENGLYKCPHCEKEFNKMGIKSHIWSMHVEIGINMRKNIEKKPSPLKGRPNPLKGKQSPLKGKQSPLRGRIGHKYTEEEKQKQSIILKKAHSEGRHPGWAHINTDKNKRSYPEKFMIGVFERNNLYEKYTIIEKMPFSKYFLDFAFIEIKLCVEVDGKQHYITPEAIEHDRIRDEFLISQGWKIYRINWITLCNNAVEEIDELINFIDNINYSTNRFYNIDEVKWRQKIPQYKIRNNKLNQDKEIFNHKTKEEYLNIIRKEFEESQQKYVEEILNSDIDFSKFGWVNKVAKIKGITPQKVNGWMKKIMPDFYEQNCFKRNETNINSIKKIKEEIEKNKEVKKQNIEIKINLILNSNIDFSKIGWIKEVTKILNITSPKVSKWMKRNMLEFYENNCFKRKIN